MAGSTSLRERYGPWAVVLGGSEGLGAAWGRALAREGLNLVLVALPGDSLDRTAAELSEVVQVRPFALDLATPDLPEILSGLADELEIGVAVYNAAAVTFGPFVDGDLADHLRVVDVSCRGPVVAAHVLGRRMAARGRGCLVLVSSLVAMQGAPMIRLMGRSTRELYDR